MAVNQLHMDAQMEQSWKAAVSNTACVTHLQVVATNHFPALILSVFEYFCVFPEPPPESMMLYLQPTEFVSMEETGR